MLIATCVAACAGPLGAIVPARTLAPGQVAVSVQSGATLPVGRLAEASQGDEPRGAAAVALAGPGFGSALGIRAGVARRLEVAVSVEPGRAALGARWAAFRPRNGWGLSLGGHGLGAWSAPEQPDTLEVTSLSAAGGGIDARVGRTWSDFLSVWLAAQADLGRWDLEARWRGADASDDGTWWSAGAALGVRVGFRSLFTGLQLGARWLHLSGERGSSQGFVLVPAFGVSVETR